MDKLNEESRKQFEEWFIEFAGHTKQWIVSRRKATGDGYVSGPGVNAFWMAWQASRASVVVELPEQRDEDFDTDVAYNEAIHDAEESLRSIGLSIKGE